MKNRIIKRLFLGAGFALVLQSGVASAADIVNAKWAVHNINFTYSGFTTYYTCDGIKDKLKLLLKTFGARNDVRIETACPGGYDDPYPMYSLKLAFATPMPADELIDTAVIPADKLTDTAEVPADQSMDSESFIATWEPIHITDNRPYDVDSGDCELVEQFARQIMPLFDTRDVRQKMLCIPHQRNAGDLNLHATILKKAQG